MAKPPSNLGVLIAALVTGTWAVTTFTLMNRSFSFNDPLTYLFVLIQMHLYTGLFITAHDAMHRTVSSNKTINNIIGQLCTALYAVFLYHKLYAKHHKHHQFVHTENDPDHAEGNFFKWYGKFMWEYISWWQVVLMAVIFNVLKLWIPEQNLLFFWVLPSLLSTLQLFFFGTWLPHHGQHDNEHHSRTQKKNHVFAFLSCYFFGYHLEHHQSPATPWWMLWKMK